jgi:hypothetical protein
MALGLVLHACAVVGLTKVLTAAWNLSVHRAAKRQAIEAKLGPE